MDAKFKKFSIENATIINCDFKGEGSRFVSEGVKWALVAIDEKIASKLTEVGIRVHPNMSPVGGRFVFKCFVADNGFRNAHGIRNITHETNLIPRILGYDSGVKELTVEELANRIDNSSGQCDIILRGYTKDYYEIEYTFPIIDTLYINLEEA